MRAHLIKSLLPMLSIIACVSNATADERPEGNPLFSITTTNEMWVANNAPGVRMTSLEKRGDTTWSTLAFTHSLDYYGLWCGLRDVPYVATLTSDSPVKERIGIVSAHFSINDHPGSLNSIVLRISKNSDMSGYEDIEVIKDDYIGADYWNFIIPEPAENLYYQLRIDTEAVSNNWIQLTRVDFYYPETNGIDSAISESSYDAIYYNLQGTRLNEPGKGINIQIKDGKARKVIK